MKPIYNRNNEVIGFEAEGFHLYRMSDDRVVMKLEVQADSKDEATSLRQVFDDMLIDYVEGFNGWRDFRETPSTGDLILVASGWPDRRYATGYYSPSSSGKRHELLRELGGRPYLNFGVNLKDPADVRPMWRPFPRVIRGTNSSYRRYIKFVPATP